MSAQTSNPFTRPEVPKRDNVLTFRVSDAELAAMKAVAGETHGALSDLVREGIEMAVIKHQRAKVRKPN